MRTAAVLLFLLAGCANTVLRRAPTPPRVVIPNTAEAMACYRECLSIRQSCSNQSDSNVTWGMEWPGVGANRCYQGEQTCLKSCPGACAESNGACYDLAGRNIYAPTRPASEPKPIENPTTSVIEI